MLVRAYTHFRFGAGDEIRTRDIYLGKVVLYQLSYSRLAATSLPGCQRLCKCCKDKK